MDFVRPAYRMNKKDGSVEIYPQFIVKPTKDLMIRGGAFYAVWDEDKGLWDTNEYEALALIDRMLENYRKSNPAFEHAKVLWMWDSDSGSVDKWHRYVQKQLGDNYHTLDEKVVFANTPASREDYASKRLGYSMQEGDYSAWDELVSVLYAPEERHKIEWAIGSVINGASKELQKFFVFYGSSGTGKSTILNVIEKLFEGYHCVFDAKALGSNNDAFALEAFKQNPLVGIQHDGDLSRIEDNARINSLVSHETMMVNEKFKSQYPMQFHTLLFMGTNRPVRITDSKSGIIRRLIDISPTEKKFPLKQYNRLVKQVRYELGAIAQHCLGVFEEDPDYYADYVPRSMIGATNDFFNFMEENFDEYREKDYTTLSEAWLKYKLYCEEARVHYPYSKRLFKEELKTYFKQFKERHHPGNGENFYNWYGGFRLEKFGLEPKEDTEAPLNNKTGNGESGWLCFDTTSSLFDRLAKDFPAQYANVEGKPSQAWDRVKTTLSDLDTAELHYVRPPDEHIVIDFDIRDENGEKNLEKNLEAANKWPKTYAELSKSGQGIHLHYIYMGDVSKLKSVFDENVEIKVFTGKQSLRRKVTRCNRLPVSSISSGLPLKEEVTMVSEKVITDEKHLRNLINKALRKEIEPYATKTSIDFIDKILTDAYETGVTYDVSNMKPAVMAFAGASTHNAVYCLDKADRMKYQSDEGSSWQEPETQEFVFFDFEVFPNLIVLALKPDGKEPVTLINPTPQQIEEVGRFQLIGFNNRNYDNHIAYALRLGWKTFDIFTLSQNIINNGKENSVRKEYMFRDAYNWSYTDVYDFCSEKQGLKKWEIELGLHHQELGLPWDKPVPEELWEKVADYCKNDVIATEAVFHAREADFKARQILVDLANILLGPGSTVNDTTNTLTAKLIVGFDRNPQQAFVYPDLSKRFPGYEFNKFGFPKERYMLPVDYVPGRDPKEHGFYEKDGDGKYVPSKDTHEMPGKQYYRCTMISGKSYYKGYDPGEGGFVYAEHDMYGNATCYDSASHHPSSLIAENGFGPYTKNFKRLLDIRLCIKHKDYAAVSRMTNGVLDKYLQTKEDAKSLSKALKIAINSVYGLTAAHFPNKLRDPRNEDNWVAKRGALFMIELMLRVKEMGYTVIHVKTDSIKIANPDEKVQQFILDFGKEYGYTFEIEHIFDRLCLVNDATYVCKYTADEENEDMAGKWDATGEQFAGKTNPYVFKTLFTGEPIAFEDLCRTYTVKVGLGLYLDMNEDLPDVAVFEKEREKLTVKWRKRKYELSEENDAALTREDGARAAFPRNESSDEYHMDYIRLCDLERTIAAGHAYHFVGKAGSFCPMKPGTGGGLLVRENNGKYASASGAKGYRWMEAEVVKTLGKQDDVDMSFFTRLAAEAAGAIEHYGDFTAFAVD